MSAMLRLTESDLPKIVAKNRPRVVKRLDGKATRLQPITVAKTRKYRNQPVSLYGMKFASKRERNRYRDLLLLEIAGKVCDIRRQVPFDLVVNGHHICRYVCDFQYFDIEKGRAIVEDTKGFVDPHNTAYRIFQIKKALMFSVHNIDVQEV